jgi:hypothetical protein
MMTAILQLVLHVIIHVLHVLMESAVLLAMQLNLDHLAQQLTFVLAKMVILMLVLQLNFVQRAIPLVLHAQEV